MKKSNYSFVGGMLSSNAVNAKLNNEKMKAFDWDKAFDIIQSKYKEHPDLYAEAGLQNDWDYTGGVIFEDGHPNNESYTFLSSCWAIPTLILSWDGEEQEEIECYETEEKYSSDSKWSEDQINAFK